MQPDIWQPQNTATTSVAQVDTGQHQDGLQHQTCYEEHVSSTALAVLGLLLGLTQLKAGQQSSTWCAASGLLQRGCKQHNTAQGGTAQACTAQVHILLDSTAQHSGASMLALLFCIVCYAAHFCSTSTDDRAKGGTEAGGGGLGGGGGSGGI